MNGYDANALEEALRLKEKHGGKVTALGLGDDTSREALKRAIAMGADAAILISDPDLLNADSAGVGRALAAAIRKIGSFDLVLSGRQASDTDGGHVLHWIAEALDLPAVTPVAKIEADDTRRLTVHRLVEDGYQRLRVELPALLGISSEINEPRFPPMRGIHGGRARDDTRLEGGRSGIAGRAPQGRTAQARSSTANRPSRVHRGESAAEQGAAFADKLRELGLV